MDSIACGTHFSNANSGSGIRDGFIEYLQRKAIGAVEAKPAERDIRPAVTFDCLIDIPPATPKPARSRARYHTYTRTCPGCGQSFTRNTVETGGRELRYCNDECRRLGDNKRHREYYNRVMHSTT
jgi:hypothetical protein